MRMKDGEGRKIVKEGEGRHLMTLVSVSVLLVVICFRRRIWYPFYDVRRQVFFAEKKVLFPHLLFIFGRRLPFLWFH